MKFATKLDLKELESRFNEKYATKQDVREVREELKGDLAALDTKLDTVKDEIIRAFGITEGTFERIVLTEMS